MFRLITLLLGIALLSGCATTGLKNRDASRTTEDASPYQERMVRGFGK